MILFILIVIAYLANIKVAPQRIDSGNRPFRGAVVLTIAGQKVPPYLAWSCYSFGFSEDSFDMLIIHERNRAILNMKCARNVIKIDVGKNGLSGLLTDVFASKSFPTIEEDTSIDPLLSKAPLSLKLSRLKSSLIKLIKTMPYFLAEFKPATGAVFAKYLKPYTHWTYTDPDIFWGNLTRWVSDQGLQAYDIVTMSKVNDAGRLFLRGQFTLHKNHPSLNWIWTHLPHMALDKLIIRMKKATNAMKRSNDTTAIKRRYFVSAEGAYSSLVFETQASIYITGRMLSDRKAKPVVWKDGVLARCRHFNLKLCLKNLKDTPIQQTVQLEHDEDDSQPLPPLNISEVKTTTEDCGMGWVGPLHQFCLSEWDTVRRNEVLRDKGVWKANDEVFSKRLVKHDSAMFHFRIWEDIFSKQVKPSEVFANESCFITHLVRSRPGVMYIQDCSEI